MHGNHRSIQPRNGPGQGFASGLADSANGTNLLPGMYGGPNRYFAAWWPRDFITMSAKTPARAAAKPGP